MERYRRLRPAPPPQSSPWASPPAQGGEGAPGGPAPWAAQDELPQPRRPPTYARAPVPTEARFRTWEVPVQPSNPRSLRVGLAGPPNAGKSSLMNAILDRPISAVSPKVNTTRDSLRGIKTMGTAQLVFIDVPGIIPSHQKQKNRDLVSTAWRGYQECDVCLLVVDVVRRPEQEIFDVVRKICPKEVIGKVELRHRLRTATEDGSSAPAEWFPRPVPGSSTELFEEEEEGRPPVILVLNKIDKASEFRWILAREQEFRAHGHFSGIFFVSAKKDQGIPRLLEHLRSAALPRPWTYPAEMVTTLSHVDQIKHMVNTHLFKWFNSDVPYKIEQQTVGWTPRLDGSVLVEHELIVEDSIVARMVLGVRNTILARLQDQVSYKLRKLWGTPVELKIWVRPLRQRLSIRDRASSGLPRTLGATAPGL